MDTIRVSLLASGWVADFAGTLLASEYVALFGTCVLPLPFAASASANVVIADVASRHPHVNVVVSD